MSRPLPILLVRAIVPHRVASALLVIPWLASAQRIERRGDEAILVLPPVMQAALQAFDPAFEPRHLSDYPSWLYTQRPCPEPRDCSKPWYQITDRQALFAAIGDFNGDKILDAVVDGENDFEGMRLVIFSHGSGFRVEKLGWIQEVDPETRRFRARPRAADEAELGVGEGLSLVKPGTYRSGYEADTLVLEYDAYALAYFEKASSIYYYRNGRWDSFTTSD